MTSPVTAEHPPPFQTLPECLLESILEHVVSGTGTLSHVLVCRRWLHASSECQVRAVVRATGGNSISPRHLPWQGNEVSARSNWISSVRETLQAHPAVMSLEDLSSQLQPWAGSLASLHLKRPLARSPSVLAVARGICRALPGLRTIELVRGPWEEQFHWPQLDTFPAAEDPAEGPPHAGPESRLTSLVVHTGGFDLDHSIQHLTSLQKLAVVSRDAPLVRIGVLQPLSQLTRLKLDCESFIEASSSPLDGMSFSARLRVLVLKCQTLAISPWFFSGMAQLRTLRIEVTSCLEGLPQALDSISCLHHLTLRCPGAIRGACHVSGMTSLRSLCVDCQTAKALAWDAGCALLSRLRRVSIECCIRESICSLPFHHSVCGFEVPDALLLLPSVRSVTLPVCTLHLPKAVLDMPLLCKESGRRMRQHKEHLGSIAFLRGQLPSSLVDLKGLKQLYLTDSQHESLPEELSLLENLRHLEIQRSRTLEALPTSIAALTGLQSLRLMECSKLKIIPAELGRLKALREIDIVSCPMIVLPEEVLHAKRVGVIWQ